MKKLNRKIFTYSLALILGLSMSISIINANNIKGSIVQYSKGKSCVNRKKYKPNATKSATITDISFSLLNQSNEPINVSVESGKAESKSNILLRRSSALEASVDIAKPVYVTVKSEKNKTVSKKYSFAPGKTIYVQWNGEDLVPQTGPFEGVLEHTYNCFVTDNNVSKNDIKRAN